MGYWEQNEQGCSFCSAEGDTKMIWGDQPADIMDVALDNIIAVFTKDVGRSPTADEIKAGLLFSLDGALRRFAEGRRFGEGNVSTGTAEPGEAN